MKYIILTHAHIDHIIHVRETQNKCGGKVVIHKDDAPLLENPMLNGAMLFGRDTVFGKLISA